MVATKNEIHQDYQKTFYRCITEKGMICHDMVEDHKIVFIMSGRLTLKMGKKQVTLNNGEAVFVRRNHLIKEMKQTGSNGEPFKGLFLHLHMDTLRKIATKINLPKVDKNPVLAQAIATPLPSHPFLIGLFSSLDQYFSNGLELSKELIDAKIYEAVLVLLQIKPELACVIFDFQTQWKIDIKEFMEKNYLSDLNIEQFAYFTGRSLSTFKRDFQTTFADTPHHWILKSRLEKAYSLIAEGKSKRSEVYLKVGFRNPDHFSTAFKRQFGITPSEVKLQS